MYTTCHFIMKFQNFIKKKIIRQKKNNRKSTYEKRFITYRLQGRILLLRRKISWRKGMKMYREKANVYGQRLITLAGLCVWRRWEALDNNYCIFQTTQSVKRQFFFLFFLLGLDVSSTPFYLYISPNQMYLSQKKK